MSNSFRNFINNAELLIVSRPVARLRSSIALGVLILAGYAGNYFNLPLFFGVDFLFGSIAVLLVVFLYGIAWGTIAAMIAGSYTFFLWGHPYAAIVLTLEGFLVGWWLRCKRQKLLLLDGFYWVFIGIPLVWLFYSQVMGVPNQTVLLILLKQSVNGIFNGDDLPKLLDSMQVGAERIHEIVNSLRNFSRLDESEIKQVDIHEGIDNTLMILKNRLKASLLTKEGQNLGIKVIKEYGDLPLVECYAGKLNQVFMNILVNAIDALEELNVKRLNVRRLNVEGLKELNVNSLNVEGDDSNVVNASISPNNLQPTNLQSATPWIRIRTEVVEGDWVAIRIADNGIGIRQELSCKLFDPFFTTKPVGQGTGLGLSISYQIVVERHGGKLECLSNPGQGSEFLIKIPRRQPGLVQ